MAWDAILTPEIAVGKPVSLALMTKIKDNLDYLYGQIGTGTAVQLSNNSFEIDSDADGEPDGWDIDLYAGGSFNLEDAVDESAADPAHGNCCIKFTHPGGGGNGGGYATSDYVECGVGNPWNVSWYQRNSAAGTRVIVEALWYDEDKVTLGSIGVDDIYDSTSNPTSWTKYTRALNAPAGARYLKVRLIGGYNDTDVAGTVEFDLVTLNDSFFRYYAVSTSGTWTRQGGRFALVDVIGGGGGGGGASYATGSGGGGGCGGRALEFIDVSEVESVAVTVGTAGIPGTGTGNGNNGGTTSFGAYVSASGGGGGYSQNSGGDPGVGGTGSGGDINGAGGPGGPGRTDWSGKGGSGAYGGGGVAMEVPVGTSAFGVSASGFGAGGSGGASGATSPTCVGGQGAPGLCIVVELS